MCSVDELEEKLDMAFEIRQQKTLVLRKDTNLQANQKNRKLSKRNDQKFIEFIEEEEKKIVHLDGAVIACRFFCFCTVLGEK
jgi:hypothetical protein